MRTPAIAITTLVWPAATTASLRAAIRPRVVSTAFTAPDGARLIAGDLAVLDDIDAERARGARIAPGHRIVSRHAAATLQRGAQDRMAQVGRDVQRRTECLGLLRRQPFVVDAVQPIGMHMALEHLHVVHRMRQHHHAARRVHDVVVQLLRQALPQLQRMLVQRGALIPKIVGADDRGVAPGVAAAEPAALQHRDVAHAMLARKIVRRGKAVAAGADNHHVVGRARLGRAPLLRPGGTAQGMAHQIEDRKPQHTRSGRILSRASC